MKILYFYSPNCSYCKKTELQLRKVEIPKGVSFEKIDATDPKNADDVAEYLVNLYPTFIFLNNRGIEINRLKGFQHKESIQTAIDDSEKSSNIRESFKNIDN